MTDNLFKQPFIMESTPRKKPSKIEFLWLQCSQCGWGQRMAKAEAEVDGWEDGSACPHCGVGPIRSSPMGRFRSTHTMLFRQEIMAGLGVSEEMLNGPTTYATSSIGARMAEAPKMITGQVTRDEYIKANLAGEMRKHRGRKRLRKKKAKRALRMRWAS